MAQPRPVPLAQLLAGVSEVAEVLHVAPDTLCDWRPLSHVWQELGVG